jgi:hypothetical protein
MSWLVQAFCATKTDVIEDEEGNPAPCNTRNIPYFCEKPNVRNTVKETPCSSGIVQPLQKSNCRNKENETLCISRSVPDFKETECTLLYSRADRRKHLERDLRYGLTCTVLRSRYATQ